MNRKLTILLVLIMFILTGCPLITINSIDNGSFVVPEYLPGKWTQLDKNGKKVDNYVIRPITKNKKGIVQCNKIYKKNQDTTLDYKIIMSEIESKVYINLYSPFPDNANEEDVSNNSVLYGYYIYEFRRVSDREFTLSGIKANSLKKDATQYEIIDFLKRNKDNQDIYDPNDFCRFKKL